MKIPLCMAYLDEREFEAIREVLESGWFTHGPKNKAFESLLQETLGVRHAITLNSCTSALQLALQANNIRGEVILPSFTFVASANSIVTAGATPVFADIEFASCNISPNSIERLISPDTEAIMVVHFAGQCCNMDKITQMAEKHHLLLIEDSAETLGATYKGRQAGSFGIGCFSFFPTKIITTGEGGALMTDDDAVAGNVRTLLAHGIPRDDIRNERDRQPWYRSATLAGYNYRMSNLLAAIGVEQLQKLHEIISLRRQHARFLNQELDSNLFQLPVEEDDCLHVYQMYTIKLRKCARRDEFVLRMRAEGIGASVHFDPPVHMQPFYLNRYRHDSLQVTEDVASRIVTLPLFPSLSKAELNYIVEVANRLGKDLSC